jgi:acyl-homoserine lactone acylase PvdQ
MAVAPARSTDGATRLVSNSHQPWTGGVAWYELVVHSEEGWDFAGANFPGSPYPFLGHNKYLGWTNTVNRPDLIDVYKLVLDDSGENYRFDGQWRPLEEKRIWLKVKFGPFVLPVPRTIYRSVHGPVVKNEKGAFAIRYAGIDQANMVTQYYRLNKAKNFAEWRAAMAGQGVPATNFIYADAKGNIGLFYNAMFPDRQPGFNWRGVLPGDTSADLWTKTLPFDRVPTLVNPRSGYVMNANNTPWVAAGPGDELDAAAFSPLLGVEDDMTNRAVRLIELFEASGQIDEARLKAIKYDTAYAKSGYAKAWMVRLLALDTRDDPALREAQDLLRRWDWNLDGKGQGRCAGADGAAPRERQPLPAPRRARSAHRAQRDGRASAGPFWRARSQARHRAAVAPWRGRLSRRPAARRRQRHRPRLDLVGCRTRWAAEGAARRQLHHVRDVGQGWPGAFGIDPAFRIGDDAARKPALQRSGAVVRGAQAQARPVRSGGAEGKRGALLSALKAANRCPKPLIQCRRAPGRKQA